MGFKVFLLGSAGHIGATVLDGILKAFPTLSVVALVRSKEDADALLKRYSMEGIGHVTPQVGALEDIELMQRLAADAQIVINCCPDMPYATNISAILDSMASSSQPGGSFYIGTSGAARIWDAPDGDKEGRVWDDIADVDLPNGTTHAAIDGIVAAANTGRLHTAVVSPPFVVGLSPSPTHRTPLIYPDLVHCIRELGCGFTIAAGMNKTAIVDVVALADLYVRLVGDAVRLIKESEDGKSPVPNPAVWGADAYYFLSSQEIPWRDLMNDVLVPAIKKHEPSILKTDGLKSLSIEEATDLVMKRHGGEDMAELWSGHIAQGFGVSMRVRGSRAGKYLDLLPEQSPVAAEAAIAAFLAPK